MMEGPDGAPKRPVSRARRRSSRYVCMRGQMVGVPETALLTIRISRVRNTYIHDTKTVL